MPRYGSSSRTVTPAVSPRCTAAMSTPHQIGTVPRTQLAHANHSGAAAGEGEAEAEDKAPGEDAGRPPERGGSEEDTEAEEGAGEEAR